MQVINSSGQVKGNTPSMVQLYDNTASGTIPSWDVPTISQAYNHLRLLILGRSDNAAAVIQVCVQFNGDTAANYHAQRVSAQAAATVGSETLNTATPPIGYIVAAAGTANRAGQIEAMILNYTGTAFHKLITATSFESSTDASGSQNIESDGAVWKNTAAINRITVKPTSGNFVAGSRLTIYGLI